jgi:uncharacterized protein (TIGR03545 family)
LLAIILIGVWVILNPVLKGTLVRVGQSMTGAKVEISSLRTSIFTTSIELRDVKVADPRAEMNNLVEIDRMRLDFSAWDLMHKRFVVEEATVSGVRFDTERKISGKLDPSEVGDMELPELPPEWADAVGDALTGMARERLEEEIESLESVQLAAEMKKRWPVEYDSVLSRTEGIRDRVESLRHSIQQPNDPIQGVAMLQNAVQELEAIRFESLQVAQDAEQLYLQAMQDAHAVHAAVDQDLVSIRERARIEGIEASDLSEYLLGEQVNHRIEETLGWIRFASKWIPADSGDQDSLARLTTGEVVDFSSDEKQPGFEIRKLRADGTVWLSGRPYDFAGEIKNISDLPGPRPTIGVFQLSQGNNEELQFQCTIDRSGEETRRHVMLNCPAIRLSSRTFGDPERLELTASPGSIHIWLEAELVGDQIEGRLLTKQTNVSLSAKMDGMAVSPFIQRLSSELQHLNTIETEAVMTGDVYRPDFQFRSNLGLMLGSAVRQAFSEEISANQEMLARMVQSRIDRDVIDISRTVETKQLEFYGMRQFIDGWVQYMVRNIMTQVGPQNTAVQGVLRRILDDTNMSIAQVASRMDGNGVGDLLTGNVPTNSQILQGTQATALVNEGLETVMGGQAPQIPSISQGTTGNEGFSAMAGAAQSLMNGVIPSEGNRPTPRTQPMMPRPEIRRPTPTVTPLPPATNPASQPPWSNWGP